jgi:hypothetical protein
MSAADITMQVSWSVWFREDLAIIFLGVPSGSPPPANTTSGSGKVVESRRAKSDEISSRGPNGRPFGAWGYVVK